MRELINPIDEGRLNLDSVHNVKSTVREFYFKKNKFGSELLQELDKMNSERPGLLKIKSSQFEHHSVCKNVKSRMLELKMETELERLQEFKRTVQQSGWFYSLITRLIAENVHEKPLSKFMADQVKIVIEAGQPYTEQHLQTLIGSLSQSDSL